MQQAAARALRAEARTARLSSKNRGDGSAEQDTVASGAPYPGTILNEDAVQQAIRWFFQAVGE
jgi:hypothetical protein